MQLLKRCESHTESEPRGAEAGGEGSWGRGREPGGTHASSREPFFPSLRMVLKLRCSPAAPLARAGATPLEEVPTGGQGLGAHPGLPKEGAFPPAALLVLPAFPGTRSPPSISDWLWVNVRKNISSALKITPGVFF